MALETASHIDELDPNNPVGSVDEVASLDNHIRLLKEVLQTDFPAITGPVTATHVELNQLDGVAIGSLAAKSTINDDDWNGADLGIGNGGTGSSSAGAARTALGVAIGSDVLAYSAKVQALAGLAVTNGGFIVGNGSTFVLETGSTVRASLGLGSLATQSSVNDGDWSGTDLAIGNGGTGSSTASGARSNLGIGDMAERDVTIQSGGAPSGGANGDVFLIY